MPMWFACAMRLKGRLGRDSLFCLMFALAVSLAPLGLRAPCRRESAGRCRTGGQAAVVEGWDDR